MTKQRLRRNLLWILVNVFTILAHSIIIVLQQNKYLCVISASAITLSIQGLIDIKRFYVL